MNGPPFLDQGDYEMWLETRPLIGVYVPTLGRPERLQQVADNIHAATSIRHRIIFVVEDHDVASLEAGRLTGERTLVNHDEPSYSNALQTAYEDDDCPYFIGGNDDFDFSVGWDVAAMQVMSQPGVQVVGIYDGNPSCEYSTISLVDRKYIEEQSGVIDMPGRVNYPYKHNYVDTEFFLTARKRGVFAKAPESIIIHRHPDFGHGSLDRTYMKSRNSMGQDAETFQSRAHLWA